MPPRARIVGAGDAGNSFGAWYGSLPVLTRAWGTAIVATTLGMRFGLINWRWLFLSWSLIFKRLEVWRLISNIFFIGDFSFGWLIRMLWIAQYVVPLEKQTYQFEPADFVYCILFCLATLMGLNAALLGGIFLGKQLLMALVYVWSKNFPDQNVSLFGMITIKSFYLPFAFLAVSLITKDDIISDMAGIAAGHAYFFLYDIYPRASGARPLRTPDLLQNLVADMGLGRPAPPPAGAASAAAPQGFQAFRGQGRRLGADTHQD